MYEQCFQEDEWLNVLNRGGVKATPSEKWRFRHTEPSRSSELRQWMSTWQVMNSVNDTFLWYIWGDYCPLYCCIIYTYFLNELFSKKVSVYHWQEREHFVRNKAIFSQFNCRDPLRTILRSRCTIGDDTILHLPLNPLPLIKDVWLGILRETYVKVNSFTHHLNRWLECIGHTQVKMHSCPNVFVCSMVGEMRSWKRPASVFAPLEGNSLPLSSHICFIGKEKLLSIVPLHGMHGYGSFIFH